MTQHFTPTVVQRPTYYDAVDLIVAAAAEASADQAVRLHEVLDKALFLHYLKINDHDGAMVCVTNCLNAEHLVQADYDLLDGILRPC
jgi:hypothetical protein